MGLKPIFFVGICIPLAKANGNMKNQIKYYCRLLKQTDKKIANRRGTLVPLRTKYGASQSDPFGKSPM
jgi:hypothetical protein